MQPTKPPSNPPKKPNPRKKGDSGGRGNWKLTCRNTRRIGSEYVARLGSFIIYREWLESEENFIERGARPSLDPALGRRQEQGAIRSFQPLMARVIGRVALDGTGKPLMVDTGRGKKKPGWWLDCIVLDNSSSRFLMHRYVDPADVECILPVPTAITRFFFAPFKEWPDRETVLALQGHGSLADEYIDDALERIGPLTVSDGPIFYHALNSSKDDFRVDVAKAAKIGRKIGAKVGENLNKKS